MKAISHKSGVRRVTYLLGFCFLLVSLIGCDAFVRKFTRKTKKENLPREEIVVAPEEYKGPNMTKEELYRQYLMYWKSWQDELITSLSLGANHKKQVDCAEQAIKLLMSLRQLLKEDKQKKLDIYIGQLNNLKETIKEDAYGNNITASRMQAERIRRSILRDFSYNKVSKDIA